MRPIKYTKKDNEKVVFHYKFSDLRKFVSRGTSHGDVGPILIGFDGNLMIYKGFGTIENPFKKMVKLAFNHLPIFDGPFLDPERMIKQLETDIPMVSAKLIFIDFSE